MQPQSGQNARRLSGAPRVAIAASYSKSSTISKRSGCSQYLHYASPLTACTCIGRFVAAFRVEVKPPALHVENSGGRFAIPLYGLGVSVGSSRDTLTEFGRSGTDRPLPSDSSRDTPVTEICPPQLAFTPPIRLQSPFAQNQPNSIHKFFPLSFADSKPLPGPTSQFSPVAMLPLN
jgi:hypothetical protein